MDTRTFLDLRPSDDPGRWYLPVVPAVSSGIGALFGGCALAAAVDAAEATTGRPLVWATAQFLDYARPPSIVEVAVTEVVRGHRLSQVRVILTVDGREIATVLGALGERPLELRGQWAQPPSVPPPEACPPRPLLRRHRNTIMERIESRLAMARPLDEFPGPPGDGRSALWLRVADLEPAAALLAIIGDYVPFGISQATGELLGGSSLDNTVRIVDVEAASRWILADVRIHALARGFAHGLVHLWSESGRLLGTASQSAIVRRFEDPAPVTSGEGPRPGSPGGPP